MLQKCRDCGLSAEQADRLLAPVRTARDESLPPEAVFTKIEEGLSKKVPPETIQKAASRRLEYLRRAALLAAPVATNAHRGQGRHGRGNGGNRRLVVQTALALESGLPETVVAEVFRHPGAPRNGQMAHVMEAAETLQLAGLKPRETRQLLFDFLDRNLNRMEIQRAVDLVIREHQKGRDFNSIHAELWPAP